MSDSQRSREVSLQQLRVQAAQCPRVRDPGGLGSGGGLPRRHDADLVNAYLEALAPKLSFQKLHLFVDTASFHKALEEEAFANLELHFPPTYAPNLNLFERIWGFSKKELLDNQYYATFPEFHEAFCTFFCDINSRKEELRSLLTEKFHIIK